MQRQITILIALLMMTTGFVTMAVHADDGQTVGVVAATIAEIEACSNDPAAPAGSCGDVGTAAPGAPGALVHDIVTTACDPRNAGGQECVDYFNDNSPVKVEQDGDYQVITVNPDAFAGLPVIVIRANPLTQHLTIVQDGHTVFDSDSDPSPAAGGEFLVAHFEYTMTPCDDTDDNHDGDPYCYERLTSGIYLDIDSTPGDASVDDTIEEENAVNLQSWARIRFDDDAFGAEDFQFDGDLLVNQPVADANEDPHERASGALHIGPEICTYQTTDNTANSGYESNDQRPNPECGRTGNLYRDTFTGDGRAWDTISEIHFKQPPAADYARYFLHSDLDDDGFPDVVEMSSCSTHPLHQESTCTDYDGDGLSNDAEIMWGADLHDRDSDNDGLIDGLEDQDSDGKLDAPANPAWAIASGEIPAAGDTSTMYPDLWKLVNIDLIDGDTATLNRATLTEPVRAHDETHDDDESMVFPGFWNPYPAHPAERARHLAMGIETSPVSRDTDADDQGTPGVSTGRFDVVGRNYDWHRSPVHRDPHPRDAQVDNEDTDGDLLFDSCEMETYLSGSEVAKGPQTLDSLGSYGTTTDHAGDEDGDGVPNKQDCDLTDHIYDVDADHDGLDDKEEIDGMLKAAYGLSSFGATFPATDPADSDDDGDGIHDGVEVFGDWNGDEVTSRWTSANRMTQGISAASSVVPSYDDIDPLMTPDVRLQLCGSPLAVHLTGCDDGDGDGFPDGPLRIAMETAYAVRTDPTKIDTDIDGLADSDELRGAAAYEAAHDGPAFRSAHNFFFTSDPTRWDTDGDTYSDGQDVKDSKAGEAVSCHRDGHGNSGAIHACDGGFDAEPWLADTDGDGLTDWEEDQGPFRNQVSVLALGIVLLGNEPDPLNFCDSVLVIGFRTGCTYEYRGDRRVADTDGDGLIDGRELKDTADPWGCLVCDGGYGTFVDSDAAFERELGHDSTDSDDDRLLDGEEADGLVVIVHPTLGNVPVGILDPTNADTDGDGFEDGDEALDLPYSHPGLEDGDDDGLSDFQEMVHRPGVPCEGGIIVDTIVDDEAEAEGFGRPLDTCDGGWGTDPLLWDTDGDSFSDGFEAEERTNPLDINDIPDGDSDNDGLNDDWERDYFGSTTVVDDPDGDFDGDDFTNGEEHATRDGNPDTLESDPTNAASTPVDRDGDGLGRAWENTHFPGGADEGADPAADPDGDGLDNAFEHDETYFANPPSERDPIFPATGRTDPSGADGKDTDNDGLDDGTEVALGTNPLLQDTDEDGLSDKEEVDGTTDPNNADSDFDGRSDGDEVNGDGTWGPTDPNNPDSDGDGYSDGLEVGQGKDPNDPGSNPGNDIEAASIPNPVAVLTNPECDFTTPSVWAEPIAGGPAKKWDSAACGDTSVGDLAGPVISDLLTEVNRLQDELDNADLDDPITGGLQISAILVNLLGENADELVKETQLVDRSDPRDLNGNEVTFEPNGQIDLIERNVMYVDRDADNVDPVDEFSGEGGYTITVMHPNSGSPTGPMANNKALVVRVGDVAGTAVVESLVIETGTGNNRVTFCQTEDNKRYVAVGWFKDVGCDRYAEAGSLVVPLGHDISDRDNDAVPHTVDNCPEMFNPQQDDTDDDGKGDACDNDIDGDGVSNGDDDFPEDGSEQVDSDGDGVGDNADAFKDDPNESVDTDGDGVGDNSDNCAEVSNADQTNTDATHPGALVPDEDGDACDDDIDGDGFPNAVEEEAGSDPMDPTNTPADSIGGQVPTPEEVQDALNGVCSEASLEGETFPECVVNAVPDPDGVCSEASLEGETFPECVVNAVPDPDGAVGLVTDTLRDNVFDKPCSDWNGEPVYACHHTVKGQERFVILVAGIPVIV